MILPFTIIPVDAKELDQDLNRKSNYLRDIICFWQKYGVLYTTTEHKNYVQEETERLPLRPFPEAKRFSKLLETLHDRDRVIQPFNSSSVWESMIKGTKDLQVAFNGWHEVFIKKGNQVEKTTREELMRRDFQDRYLPGEDFECPCNDEIFKKLARRWTPWIRQMVPWGARKSLEIVIFDPYIYDLQVSKEYLIWSLDLINEESQFNIDLTLFSKKDCDLNAFKRNISGLLNKYPKVQSCLLYVSENFSRPSRHIRIADTCVSFNHPPSKKGNYYSDKFGRKHLPPRTEGENIVDLCLQYERALRAQTNTERFEIIKHI